MIRIMLAALALAAPGLALAKLPPPDEAAKAKAAEAAAKSAWQGKVDMYQLCKAQDKVVAYYKKAHPAEAKAAPVAAQPASSPTAASASTASQGGSTPVAAVAPVTAPPPGCSEPGPFTYAPPEQKPLETSGAHSPAATAASPPSVRAESASMTTGKAGAAPAKK